LALSGIGHGGALSALIEDCPPLSNVEADLSPYTIPSLSPFLKSAFFANAVCAKITHFHKQLLFEYLF
jgi:hypothetical protein